MSEQGERTEIASTDMLAFASFLAGYQQQLNDLRYALMKLKPAEIKDALIMKWPVIQGTQNQMNLQRVAKLPWTNEQVARAVQFILEANASSVTSRNPTNER